MKNKISQHTVHFVSVDNLSPKYINIPLFWFTAVAIKIQIKNILCCLTRKKNKPNPVS